MFRISTLSIVAACAAAVPASALSVNLSGLDVNTQFNANGGSFTDVSVPLGSTSATHSFTVTGLDIAGDTSADDTVTFSYDVASTGGVIENITGNAFSYGVDGDSDPGDNEIDPGETLSFSNLTAVATFGTDPGLTLVIDSAAFTGFSWRFVGGDTDETVDVAVDGGNFTAPAGGSASSTFDTPTGAFAIGGGITGSNGFGIDSITATFELSAVPEPGSLALLGLGGLMIARRRRG